MAKVWRVPAPKYGFEWEGELEAYWEAHLDPISDDYTPEEISAPDLFRKWVARVREDFPDGLIPIHWYVQSQSAAKFERMPFQFNHHKGQPPHEDFLTHYGWPVDAQTSEELNWLTLPVVDKLWNAKRVNKGGFIQEATGWKPSVLQPHVFLSALVQATGV